MTSRHALPAAGALLAAGLAGVGAAPGGAQRAVTVNASEYSFAPAQLYVSPGEALEVEMANLGQVGHDLVFDLGGGRVERTPLVGSGGRAALSFDAPAAVGTYIYYCSIGYHREVGMEGQLVVEVRPPTPTPAPYEVFVGNLRAPRGLAVHGDTLLVGEGGTGAGVAGQFAPGNRDGRVSRLSVASPAERSVLVGGLANVVDPAGGVYGANQAVFTRPASATSTALVALSGGPGHPDPKAQILAVPPGGPVSVLADLWAFEAARNPDGGAIGSDPWRLTLGADGWAYVTDAGANAVVRVDPLTGDIQLVAALASPGTDGAGAPLPAQPTGLVARDGGGGPELFVALAAGHAPAAGQVRLLVDANGDGDALDADENLPVAYGLSGAVDLARSPAGELYVLEHEAGRVSWVPTGGATGSGVVPLVAGLFGASGMAFTDAGDLLVSVARRPEDGPKTDRIVRVAADRLRVEGLPTPTAGTPAPRTPTATRPAPTASPTVAWPVDPPKIYLPAALRAANRP